MHTENFEVIKNTCDNNTLTRRRLSLHFTQGEIKLLTMEVT